MRSVFALGRSERTASPVVMKLTSLLSIALVLPASVAVAESGRVVAYFTSWGVYEGDYHVDDIPADRLTHINYAFANVSAESGQIALGDPSADTDRLYPGDSHDPLSLHGNFNQLLLLKRQHPHLKTLISVGGWTWSGNFSAAAETAGKRRRLARSCAAFAARYRRRRGPQPAEGADRGTDGALGRVSRRAGAQRRMS